jgi:hypothetical protein
MNISSLVLWVLVSASWSCGQAPSFNEKPTTTNRSGDVIVGQQNGAVDVSGKGGEGEQGDPGGDGIGGLDEAPVDGGGSNGDGDAGGNGADAGGNGADAGSSGADAGSSGEGSGDGATAGTGGTGSTATGAGSAEGGGSTGAQPTPTPTPVPTEKRAQTFDADRQAPGTVNASLVDPYLDSEITMARNYKETARSYDQLIRPRVRDSFVQGNVGIPEAESTVQTAKKPLDILVVVDNSGSMQEEQNNLSTKLAPLLTYVADSDWRVAVTTTDPDKGCLIDVIDKTDSNREAAFATAVRQGTNGSGNERGILQAVNGLTCAREAWLRDQSALAVLIVSDEDNCSNGQDCQGKAYATKNYLIDHLRTIRVPGVNAKVYGLIWHSSQPQSACSTAQNQGRIYSELVADTMGTWGSICDADYSATLMAMSQNISTILDRRFPLKKTPDAGSLSVSINNIPMTSGYQLQGNVVVFDLPPADGDTVRFNYTTGAKPIRATFTLTERPLNDQFDVHYNNTLVDPLNYDYDETTRLVTFLTTPPEKATVNFTYTKNVPLTEEFAIGAPYVPASLKVFINNVETVDYDVLPGGIVKPDTVPTEGSRIILSYTEIGNPILAYSFTVNGKSAKKLAIKDKTTGQAVPFVYLLNFITFLQADWQEGRVLTVEYWNEARDAMTVMLPNVPVAGSVSATADGVRCGAQYVAVTGQTAVVTDCGFPATAAMMTLDFKYVAEQFKSFTFSDPDVEASTSPKTWRVWVNGTEVKNFTVTGNVIEFADYLPVGAKVQVQVEFVK